VFQVGNACCFVLGAKPTKASCGDGTGFAPRAENTWFQPDNHGLYTIRDISVAKLSKRADANYGLISHFTEQRQERGEPLVRKHYRQKFALKVTCWVTSEVVAWKRVQPFSGFFRCLCSDC